MAVSSATGSPDLASILEPREQSLDGFSIAASDVHGPESVQHSKRRRAPLPLAKRRGMSECPFDLRMRIAQHGEERGALGLRELDLLVQARAIVRELRQQFQPVVEMPDRLLIGAAAIAASPACRQCSMAVSGSPASPKWCARSSGRSVAIAGKAVEQAMRRSARAGGGDRNAGSSRTRLPLPARA